MNVGLQRSPTCCLPFVGPTLKPLEALNVIILLRCLLREDNQSVTMARRAGSQSA